MAWTVLLLLTFGAEIAFCGQKLNELKKIRAETDDQGEQLEAIIAKIGEVKARLQSLGGGGGSSGSGGSGSSVQTPEAGTYVPTVCPITLETGVKRTKCHDVETNGISGVYTVNIAGQAKKVYCDMSTDGGGWLVFQRRMDGKTDFYRDWGNYSEGFGNPDSEFWIGNKMLHTLTNSASYQLRVDVADKADNCRYAYYSKFRIADEDDEFRLLTIGAYSGNAGNSLNYHLNMMFTTLDQDHDLQTAHNCAVTYTGAWWYQKCHHSNLNGKYADDSFGKGINWYHFKGHSYSLPFAEMKIRPN